MVMSCVEMRVMLKTQTFLQRILQIIDVGVIISK